MKRSLLIFENSPWLILICLVIAAVLTYSLYRKPGPWSSITHYTLIAFRFLLISFLCFLLVGPIVKQFINRIEKPYYVLAIDNSASISEVLPKEFLSDQINKIKTLGQTLGTSGYEVEYRTLDQTIESKTIDSIRYDRPSTPLNDLLKRIQMDYEGKNISGVVLFSDGIHNQGLSPVFTPFKFPVYCMGIGDTIPKQDVRLKAVHYNKIAYQGSRFIIRAEILNDGFADNNMVIKVSDRGRTLQSKTLKLKNPPQLLETDFKLEATNKGLKDFTITIEAVDEEFSLKNNVRHAYIEIIEGRRKILLASKNPHPDIKAIKSAIEKNENYQLDLYIPGISNPESESYDLIILHQISQQELRRIPTMSNHLKAELPLWTIVGSKSNLNRVNSENKFITIKTINFQRDLVTPSFNSSFSKFQLSPALEEAITYFNPVSVPFANYEIGGGAEILMFQKVGNLVTSNPLLAIIDDGDRKTAVMVGEGMWQWRMQDYAKNQSFELFDELVSKLVQYLSSNEEKNRFKVYPLVQEFSVNEPAILETEVYNEIYNETYGHAVELELRGPNGFVETYSYVTSLGNTKYRISDLPPGIYTFKAQTYVDQKPVRSQGQFTVTEMQLEVLSLTANHQLLRSLSSKTNGVFYSEHQWENLTRDLSEKQAQGIIFSEEIFTPLIKWPWALGILLVLVSMEWILRKYHGSY